jgi:hypothetical protein
LGKSTTPECIGLGGVEAQATCPASKAAAIAEPKIVFGPAPSGGITIKNFRVEGIQEMGMAPTTPTASVAFKAVVLKEGATTGITCKATSAEPAHCEDSTHSATIAAGEYVEVQVEVTSTLAMGDNGAITASFVY